MRKKILVGILLLTVFATVLHTLWNKPTPLKHGMIDDVGHLLPTKIDRVVKGKEVEQLKKIVIDAKKQGKTVSIAGQRHSQGGHTYYKDGVVIDLKTFNKVEKVDPVHKTVIVQSGATWGDIQKAINPYNLALKVTQSQEIFSVGGSLSVNAHGRDIRNHSLASTVNWFTLLTPTGKVIKVSRTENKELFPYVLGGYGLFGVILEVELQLTNNELYQVETKTMEYDKYPAYFKKNVLENKNASMHIARISVAPDSFFDKVYAINYMETSRKMSDSDKELKEDHSAFLPKLALGMSRTSDIGKDLFWQLQYSFIHSLNGSYETRNNVMRSESKFMEFDDRQDTQVLQEFFVPVDEFVSYIDDVREYLQYEHDFNLLNITIRYVEKDNETVMNYAKDDMFAFVVLIQHGKDKDSVHKASEVIQKWTDLTIKHRGSYYLPYYPYQTKQQMQSAYPRTEDFFNKKKEFDPNRVFMNTFYENYGE
ncbi:FAD-binding oxidoreductase [Bacillus sp. AFS002410]|uniref:FAD-binding oxidoreductase n=1 Tax=Bacillus sp. AFS002410 TaxID=2033481 RepID=UPI000BF159D9|nr:FAD-binding oxidoreductase [Bacillus sp. AFS002410]PEJ53617.1 FAD-binding oxidoreductase [Bacillus sp. AFS002410]